MFYVIMRFFIAYFLCHLTVCSTAYAQPGNSHKDATVVFIGNSITLGWKTAYPEFFANGYFVNKGIGGQTTVQILSRFQTDVIDLHPHTVIVMGGTNDIAGLGGYMPVDSIFLNLVKMVEMALKHHINVILCSVLPAHAYACCPSIKPIPLIAELNVKLRSLAAKKKIQYLDYYSVLLNDRKGIDPLWSDDGVHPNKVGYARMVPMTMAAIVSSLESKPFGNYK